ncbi:hypothetical protein LTR84_010851 [Exophiala bonariae]|uniref:UBA domain-containing protein n=1 Tax=Exophiala bonariae TaxID=1690606 RepID=A0AAV9NK21_9EURO|nr:hypothetical protein LTR84_010851 [Exophiala bonariae]
MAHDYSEEMVLINRIDKSWAPVVSFWQQYRASHGKTSSSGQLDSTIESMRDKVCEAYDGFADALGKNFVRGDHLFESDMDDIEKGVLSQLSASLRALSSTTNRQPESSHDHEAESTKLALRAIAGTIRTLERLASRLGYNVQSSKSMGDLCDDSPDIDWCKGALLVQQTSASHQFILAQPDSQLAKVCKFCYLEVSDYRSKAVRHTDQDWSALASCHVLACSSFKDRRAAYRCFGCYISGVSKIHTSAAAMLDHLAACEEFNEKRTRSQSPPRTTTAGHKVLPSSHVQSYSDSSASSTPSTPSSSSTHSTIPPSIKLRTQASQLANQTPISTRGPPPVPSMEAGPAYPPRPETQNSVQRVPGTFPMAEPIENPRQPYPEAPNFNAHQQSSNLFRPPTLTPRKPIPIPSAQPSLSPQSPSRTPHTTWSPHPAEPAAPLVSSLPPQVRQLMELGATKLEAENGLKEMNWDVPQAVDMIWRNRQDG